MTLETVGQYAGTFFSCFLGVIVYSAIKGIIRDREEIKVRMERSRRQTEESMLSINRSLRASAIESPRILDYIDGEGLDNVGEVFGVPRPRSGERGLFNDNDYRMVLKAHVEYWREHMGLTRKEPVAWLERWHR